jgi:hypothetical protein
MATQGSAANRACGESVSRSKKTMRGSELDDPMMRSLAYEMRLSPKHHESRVFGNDGNGPSEVARQAGEC